ncbi:hypothetical protein [Xanthobacter sediminis]
MASSVSRSGPWPVRASSAAQCWEGARISSRHASLLISLVVVLFAALLIATPPLALLVGPVHAPAAPPPPHMSYSVSQLA